MEEASGNSLISLPRAINAVGDMIVKFDQFPKGFICLGDNFQVSTCYSRAVTSLLDLKLLFVFNMCVQFGLLTNHLEELFSKVA